MDKQELNRIYWLCAWLACLLTLLLTTGCSRYHECIVVEKSEYIKHIQTVVIGSNSTHFISPHLNWLDYEGSYIGDTLRIKKKGLTLDTHLDL